MACLFVKPDLENRLVFKLEKNEAAALYLESMWDVLQLRLVSKFSG